MALAQRVCTATGYTDAQGLRMVEGASARTIPPVLEAMSEIPWQEEFSTR